MPPPTPPPTPPPSPLAALHPSWARALAPVEEDLARLDADLTARRAGGEQVLPAPEHVLRAFEQPLEEVRVLLLGQDPYPRPGHAVGLAFSVAPHVRPLPPTLRNLLKELTADTGAPAPSTGDLSPWSERGVLLLNRVLTVRAGESGSHRRLGWERVTDAAVRALAARGGPLVSVLWGRDAQTAAPLLAGTAVLTGVHPSPLSASRGFHGSRPFSAVDAALRAQGAPPVGWALP
ncbi:uracil-DNA glycosylase [Quadrisphaera sp. KR29]|uniref:uracil-DNA glycosylase n=1 Tax=Quadrisphaera sp. KR29 TaxID=3461391 RepID=UPI004044754D